MRDHPGLHRGRCTTVLGHTVIFRTLILFGLLGAARPCPPEILRHQRLELTLEVHDLRLKINKDLFLFFGKTGKERLILFDRLDRLQDLFPGTVKIPWLIDLKLPFLNGAGRPRNTGPRTRLVIGTRTKKEIRICKGLLDFLDPGLHGLVLLPPNTF